MAVTHWADALKLRSELLDNQGQITGLQMSLFGAVYQTMNVPYQDARYYSDITEPTPSLLRFLGVLAARLGTTKSLKALYHLDQGMGGGKSHALVGAYHLASSTKAFLGTDLGKAVRAEAEQIANGSIDLTGSLAVVLSADNMSPGKASPEFGPATTLHERFLWGIFQGDKAAFAKYLDMGSDKAALRRALEAVDRPVLILLDELMDYAMQLSDKSHLAGMPGEKAFLNALMDAADDVSRVAFVIVMIRSDLDEKGYSKDADDFRSYIEARLARNGTTVAVTEAQDFAAIIQRRLFERAAGAPPISAAAKQFEKAADEAWREQVFDRLGAGRGLTSFGDRVAKTYPFHPDLMALVRDDWSRHAGFQRVRSTVEIFAATAHHWVQEHRTGRWAPALMNVGDIPVTVAIEQVLSSGLLHGNEKAIQGYRQVAATDIASKDGQQGRAVALDRGFNAQGVSLGQPAPAVRMASALFYYSLVARAQARRGATKPEILAAVFTPEPACSFAAADEVFNALVGEEEGLGALEVIQGNGGNTPTRYQLSTTYTLRMFYKQARSTIQAADKDDFMWERAQSVATRGLFDELLFIDAPKDEAAPLEQVFERVDQNGKTRLVVLDPRRWTLLNGRDSATRSDILSLLGLGPAPLAVDNAASCVIACVNTQRREGVRKRATEVLAWRNVMTSQIEPTSEQWNEAKTQFETALARFDAEVKRAFQHIAFVVRTNEAQVEWDRFDDDNKSALRGEHVWEQLVSRGRAVKPRGLSETYLGTLLGAMPRGLSLKEVVQQFTKNPAFPITPSTAEIRNAVFQLLGGAEPWEIVDDAGQPLDLQSSEDLALGSADTMLRRRTAGQPVSTTSTLGSGGNGGTTPVGGGQGGAPGGGGGASVPRPVTYMRYSIRLPNRSVVNPQAREALWRLLGALSDVVDPGASSDLQLVDLSVTITAAQGALEQVKPQAEKAAAKWGEEEDMIS